MIFRQRHRGFRLIQASGCRSGSPRPVCEVKEITPFLTCDEEGSTSTLSSGEELNRPCRPSTKSAEIRHGAESSRSYKSKSPPTRLQWRSA